MATPPTAQPAAAGPAKAAKPAKPPRADKAPKADKPEKAPKPPKAKLVRDSYTIPADEHAALAALKSRALSLAHAVKKSELLRAGLKQLQALDDATLLAALKAVPPLKTGRPGR